MKKIIGLLICMILVLPLTGFSTSVYADEWGGITWSFENGELTFSGEGELPDRGPWENICTQATTIIFNEGITSAFYLPECPLVETIIFHGNSGNVASPWMIRENNSLKHLQFTSATPYIGDEWFCNARLSSITFSSSTANFLKEGNFLFNKDKTTLYYFFDDGRSEVIIPEGVTIVASCAFANSSISRISFPSTIKEIRGYAFYNCKNLLSVSLPKSIARIGRYAFAKSGLTSVEFLCNSIDFYSHYETWNTNGGFEFSQTNLVNVNLPVCSQITDGMFSGCLLLNTVSFAEGSDCTFGLQRSPFFSCQELKSVYLPPSVSYVDYLWFTDAHLPSTFTILCHKDSQAEKTAKTYSIKYQSSEHDLISCGKVESTCTESGIEAYWKCDLCGKMFSDEAENNEITEPIEIPALGHNWTKSTYEWSEDYSQVTASHICKRDEMHTETETVNTTSKKKAATYTKAGSITYTAKFNNPAFKKQTKKITIPKLPVDIKQDGNKYHLDPKKKTATFTGAEKKTVSKITIPDTIKDNGKTFKVTEIAADACKELSKLKSISIGKNVKSIGAKAFYNCKKLAKITIKTTKLTTKTVGANAFKGIYKKATIKCPKSKLKAYKTLFTKKGAPKTVKYE